MNVRGSERTRVNVMAKNRFFFFFFQVGIRFGVKRPIVKINEHNIIVGMTWSVPMNINLEKTLSDIFYIFFYKNSLIFIVEYLRSRIPRSLGCL